MRINMQKIRNYNQLINKGDAHARSMVLKLMDEVLHDVDAGRRIYEMMRLEEDMLVVGNRTWDLQKKNNIYLIGSGKACNAMAQAVCNIIGDRLTRGIISVKIAEPEDHYYNTEVYVGGHPLPNEKGMTAAQKILELIDQATQDDLFISVFSGGSSALLTCPIDGISLQDEIDAQDILLKSGAKILEINAVRRHISRSNGGRFAERIAQKGAELINLMVGDAVGRPATVNRSIPAEFFGTMVAADDTTIKDARDAIVNYDLMGVMPTSIVRYLWDDTRVKETPKQFGQNVTTFLLGSVPDSCESAVIAAEKMGMPCMVLSTFLEGESKEAGFFLSSLAREIQLNHRPVKPPCFVVCSGETTTCIKEPAAGIGGPSHELALGCAIGIKSLTGISIASIDTEGTDGTTGSAGGIVDTQTLRRLEEKGVSIYDVFRRHSSGDALISLQDNVFTGNTGTNLCDFNVMFISN